jgi:hypothetical protein
MSLHCCLQSIIFITITITITMTNITVVIVIIIIIIISIIIININIVTSVSLFISSSIPFSLLLPTLCFLLPGVYLTPTLLSFPLHRP